MNLDPDVCYRAVLARDARHDGQFFTCVKTTGIYCRPVCPARTPKRENCSFVASTAAAQEAGFRPCLRCRPESAPDLGAWRGASATVSRALRLIEDGALDEGDVDGLAARLGVGERHLRRLFAKHLGAAPVTVAQTRRVLLAKQLIHQTVLPMAQVALASGFGSVRRFNETFQALYDRPPGDLRRSEAAPSGAGAGITLLLPYRAPYAWNAMLGFLQTRAIDGVETVTERRYARVIELDGALGWVEVGDAPEKSALRVTVHFPRLDLLPQIIARLRRVFDLAADPAAIGAALSRDPALAPLVTARPGLRVPGAWSGFEIAVRAILGQQITVTAAIRLASRLSAELGAPLPEPMGHLRHAFPGPERFSKAATENLPMPRARSAAIAGLAAAAEADPRLFDPRGDLDDAIVRLKALPGIGEWTAQYIAMRALRESDAFLAADVGLQRVLGVLENGERPSAKALLARAETWRPWRAYAALHLWMAETQNTDSKTGDDNAIAA